VAALVKVGPDLLAECSMGSETRWTAVRTIEAHDLYSFVRRTAGPLEREQLSIRGHRHSAPLTDCFPAAEGQRVGLFERKRSREEHAARSMCRKARRMSAWSR